MAEVIKKATRDGYGAGLLKLGEKYDDFLVLDADLAEATKTAVFKKQFPDRFYDCGIAEQNYVKKADIQSAFGHFVHINFTRHRLYKAT